MNPYIFGIQQKSMIKNLQVSFLIKNMSFPFISMLYLHSNIPSKIFYASISSEITRIVRKTTNLINIVTHVNPLLIKMI